MANCLAESVLTLPLPPASCVLSHLAPGPESLRVLCFCGRYFCVLLVSNFFTVDPSYLDKIVFNDLWIVKYL